MPRSRQQRRARDRRPRRVRRSGSRLFATSMVVIVMGGLFAAYVFRSNPPPITRGAIAGEHWHAAYRIYICGQRVTNYPQVHGEVHSHGDGFMHIHPSTPPFSGNNANVGAFLRTYETTIGLAPNGDRMLVFPDGTRYEDGDRCPDDKRYEIEVLQNGDEVDGDPALVIPHDGDEVVIRFGPEGDEPLPNPYAKTKGIPDAGFGQDRPAVEGAEPTAPAAPPEATAGATPEASP